MDEIVLQNCELFLFDMDGTLYLGDNLFSFTNELLKTIRDQGGRYIFVTNNSSKSVSDYIKKLEKLGIPAEYNDFMTSSQATALYLLEHHKCDNLYVCGTKSLKKELIDKASDVEYWQRANFFDIEKIRTELRELIKFIDNPPRKIWSIDIEDTLRVEEESEPYILTPTGDYSSYKRKVTKFLNGNLDNLIIYKIKYNKKLNDEEKKENERIMFEELGNNSEFVQTFGNKNVIQVVRNIVGLDSQTANNIFSKYINDNRLNSKQIQFVKMLIDYVIKNGTISLQVLTEDPFSSLGAVSEVFEDNVGTFKQIRQDIEEINRNAEMFA